MIPHYPLQNEMFTIFQFLNYQKLNEISTDNTINIIKEPYDEN